MSNTPSTTDRPRPSDPPAFLRPRLEALRQRLRDSEADVMLITHPPDIRYLTGFAGDDSWAVVSPRSGPGGGVSVISDSRFAQQITRESPHVRAVIRQGGLVDELARWLKGRKRRVVGVQAEHLSLELARQLEQKLGELPGAVPGAAVVSMAGKMVDQRAVKDGGEVEGIRAALAIQQRAFTELIAHLEPGMTEQRLAAELEYRMRCLGSEGPSFPTIAAIDANAALPHAVPGSKKLGDSSLLLIDWGAKSGGYCSDLTRVVALGKMTDEMARVYQVVLDAQQAGIDAIAPGASGRAVDAAARKVIEKAGYGQSFGHGLGHGIGLEIHEQPTLSPRSPAQGVLEPGHVVTVEPGIYLPGVGGVRIEDDVLVTEGGAEVLSDLPKSLESAMI